MGQGKLPRPVKMDEIPEDIRKMADADRREVQQALDALNGIRPAKNKMQIFVESALPRIEELTEEGMSLTEIFEALSAKMEVWFAYPTFSRYVQAARKAAGSPHLKTRQRRKKD